MAPALAAVNPTVNTVHLCMMCLCSPCHENRHGQVTSVGLALCQRVPLPGWTAGFWWSRPQTESGTWPPWQQSRHLSSPQLVPTQTPQSCQRHPPGEYSHLPIWSLQADKHRHHIRQELTCIINSKLEAHCTTHSISNNSWAHVLKPNVHMRPTWSCSGLSFQQHCLCPPTISLTAGHHRLLGKEQQPLTAPASSRQQQHR